VLSCNKQFRKDVRLPVQLQRAMAAEAEAAREARAKVGSVYNHKISLQWVPVCGFSLKLNEYI